MSDSVPRLLLDTHALLWLTDGALKGQAEQFVVAAGRQQGILISSVSAWEIGLLARPKHGPARIRLQPDPARWLQNILDQRPYTEIALTSAVALAASSLPGEFHRDPADRLLVATARELNVPLVTRDRRILEYAEAGHIQAIPC